MFAEFGEDGGFSDSLGSVEDKYLVELDPWVLDAGDGRDECLAGYRAGVGVIGCAQVVDELGVDARCAIPLG